MPKRVTVRYEPMIVLDTTSSVPLYRQLYDRLRFGILTGRLATGTRLPATRTLADQLGVSRNTVYLAYQRLLAEGYIDGKVGHGTSVMYVTPETRLTISSTSQVKSAQDDTPCSRVSQRGMSMARLPPLPRPQVPSKPGKMPAFRAGMPALDLFPYQICAQMVTRRVRHSLQEASDNQDPAGYHLLREAIATAGKIRPRLPPEEHREEILCAYQEWSSLRGPGCTFGVSRTTILPGSKKTPACHH